MMFIKTKVVISVVVIVSVLSAVIALLTARHFYFQSKLGAAEPVKISEYAAENEIFHRNKREKGTQRPRIVLVGDSRVKAMRLVRLEAEWDVLNRGVSGETSAQLSLRFSGDALALNPDVILIQSGINDLVAGMGDQEMMPIIALRTIDNLKNMASQAAAMGSRVVLMTVIPPAHPDLLRRLVWSENIREQVAYVNGELKSWKPPEGVIVVDVSKIFGLESVLPMKYALNTLHLNDKGNHRLVNAISHEVLLLKK